MALLDLSKTEETYNGGYDAAIKHYVHGKEGGVVIDFTDFPDNVMHKGHGIIKEGSDEDPIYKPQPIDGSKHDKLVGVSNTTTTKSYPSTGMMTHGTINSNATKYPFNAASLKVLKEMGVYNQVD